jgi:hypothetical protein
MPGRGSNHETPQGLDSRMFGFAAGSEATAMPRRSRPLKLGRMDNHL